MVKFCAFFLVCIFLVDTKCCGATTRIVNVTCDPDAKGDCESESLKTIAADFQEYSDVQIDIIIPQLHLDTNISFTNFTSLTISGNSDSLTTIECEDDAGIMLSNITNITLRRLKILFCGSHNSFNGNNGDRQSYISALTIIQCKNMDMNELIITSSEGVGMTILKHQGGRVNIASSSFEHNKLSRNKSKETEEKLIGGGGVYMELNYSSQLIQHSPLKVVIDNCTFENNTADTNDSRYLYTDAVGVVHKGAGRGGGMNLIVGPGLKNVSILFKECTFTDNQAFHGSGLGIKLLGEEKNYTEYVSVEIVDSVFEHNGRYIFGFGGGVYIVIYQSSDGQAISNCQCILRNVTFLENQAEHGGSAYLFSSRQRFPNSNSLVFDNCIFMNNTAHIGSAVIVAPNIRFSLSAGYSVTPEFHDCQFLGNSVNTTKYHEIQKTHGIGTIYISECKVTFTGLNLFKNNNGTGIYIVNGVIDFQNGSAHFENNHAIKGAALALIGSSVIIVGQNDYKFIDNTAWYQGGAIHISLIDKTDFTISQKCFIQYVNDINDTKVLTRGWELNMLFSGNTVQDGKSGHAIYATSFIPCQIIDSDIVNISQIFTKRSQYITFDNNTTQQPQLATDVARIIDPKGTKELTVIPGQEHQHKVHLIDDCHNDVNSSFQAALINMMGNILLDPSRSVYLGSEIKLIGWPGSKANLLLQTLSPRGTYITLPVILGDCPPGFKLSDDLECICNSAAYIGIFECDSYHSHLLPGYWAGIFNTSGEERLVTSACPFKGQCLRVTNSSRFYTKLPKTYSRSEMNQLVCGDTRIGVACGHCQGEFTAYFHSPDYECRHAEPFDCKLGWLFYILSELVPVTLLFITVLVLNVSFTSGAVNSFILFSQLVINFDIDAGGIIQFPEHAQVEIDKAKELYTITYGFLDLDIFNSHYFSFCLWKGASPINLFAFKYFTLLYTVLLIVGVILIMNNYGGRCLGKCFRISSIKVSVINGISTFLVLCYSQCMKVSLGLLIPLHIHVPKDDSNFTCTSCTRVWFDGELIYLHREHLPYALPAIFCLLTVGALPPILLLSNPLLNKILLILGLEENRFINVISRKISLNSLKPLLDTFQGCFKDNMRFFAGLYFLYRWMFHVVFFVKSYDQYYATVSGMLVVILSLHTICQPYIKKVHNIIDTLLFANLLLINFFSYLNFQSTNTQSVQYGSTVAPAVMQLILIYTPLIVMVVYQLSTACIKLVRKPKVITILLPKQAIKLRQLLQGKVLKHDSTSSNEEHIIHERLIDSLEYYREYHNQ